jgi:tetratricopeptide (TPR) repeat protein
MRKKSFLFVTLACILSFTFAQQNKTVISANKKVSVVPNQTIGYSEDALISEKEGLVIYRIFLDENQNYKRHALLYATHQVLADAVGDRLSQSQFTVSQPVKGNFHFISPFVFELGKGAASPRSADELMQDGNACMQYGLPKMALHFYDQILDRKRKKDSDFFALHQARSKVFLQMNNWLDARQEVTNMLAYTREPQSLYADEQMALRMERSILDLISGNATHAIDDLSWLNRNGEHKISLISDYIKSLNLTREEARQLVANADKLQENMPGKTKFWLTAIAAVSSSHAQLQAQAQARFAELLQQESNPEYQAALLCQIGWSMYNQGKPVEALSQLQEATHLSPKMAQAHFYKALSLARLDYGTEAYDSMRSALELGLPHEQQTHGQQMLSILAGNR